ncbi:vacuolar protein sorting-associated protein [Anaeramoeba ignava]|uniref:Vacuolar protein sorting-associated protein n=1 Tax=Anaeramoeba ignava TaxID=1746090 RepID=A0A9Q0R6N0_ANAIG|nr:vacuolar protein sorting-associated protein [Anaeramoeba ignava]
MGEGKTKVIGPILAFLQSKIFQDKKPLLIFLTPESLIETNSQDMKITSKYSFNQKLNLLQFSRNEENIEKENLKNILEMFKKCKENYEFIISTAESIQCLELEYISLIDEFEKWEEYKKNQNQNQNQISKTKKQKEEEEKKQEIPEKIQILNQILEIIKKESILTIDEVDNVLSVFRNVNFTTGEKDLKFKDYQIEIIKTIYKKYGNELKEEKNTILTSKEMKQKQKIIVENILEILIPEQVDNQTYEKYFDYLMNEISLSKKDFEKQKDPNLSEKLSWSRYILNDLLPQVIDKQPNEHFGISKEKWKFEEKNSKQIHVAIPYKAANKPIEGSIFANIFETLCKTIHYYYYIGLPSNKIQHFLSFLQREYKQLASENSNKHSKLKKQIQKEFKIDISEVRIDQLSKPKLEEIQKIVNKNLFNPKVYAYSHFHQYIKEEILEQFGCESRQLNSTSSDLCSFFQLIVGYSGTSQTKERDQSLGRVVNSLLQIEDKNIFIIQPKKTPLQLFEEIFKKNENNFPFQTFIDVGAYFKGFTNTEIAKEMMIFFSKHKKEKEKEEKETETKTEIKIKGILFFDEKDFLSIIKENEEENDFNLKFQVIKIGRSDPKTIQTITQLNQEEIFTFYDQSHTIGADIQQPLFCEALLSISEKTQTVQLLQGAMRMRKLNYGTQKISFIIPQPTSIFIKSTLSLSEEENNKNNNNNNNNNKNNKNNNNNKNNKNNKNNENDPKVIKFKMKKLTEKFEKIQTKISKIEKEIKSFENSNQKEKEIKSFENSNKKKKKLIKKKNKTEKKIDKLKPKSIDIISFTFINDLKQFSLISIHEIIQEINTIIKSEIFEWILEIKELEKKRKLFKLFGKEGEIFIKQNIQDYWKQYSKKTEMEDSKEIIKNLFNSKNNKLKIYLNKLQMKFQNLNQKEIKSKKEFWII